MVTKRQLDTLEQRIDRLLPERRPEYKVYLWFDRRVEADEDGTPSLPLRDVARITDGKAYNDKGIEVRWTSYRLTDEDKMRLHPELRGKDGKIRPTIKLHFS